MASHGNDLCLFVLCIYSGVLHIERVLPPLWSALRSMISTQVNDQRADRSIGRLVHMIRRMSNHLISTDRSAYNMWGADRCRCHMSERDHPFLFLAPSFPSKKEKFAFLWLIDPALVYCSRFSLSPSFAFVSHSLCNTLPLSQWRGTHSFPSL